MGFKVGGQQADRDIAEVASAPDGDVTAGEDLYAILLAALSGATDAEQLEAALALSNKTPWSELSQGMRDLFDAAGDAFEELDPDDNG